MRLSLRDKVQLYHELSKLVKAGFGFDRSVELLEDQARNRAQGAFANAIRKGLQKGRTITQSIDESGVGVSPLETSIIRAAEGGGVLEDGFEYLKEYFEAQFETRRDILVRLIYPAILLHLAAFLPVVPDLVLGNGFASLQRSFGLLGMIYFLAVTLGASAWMLNESGRTNLRVDSFLRNIPLIGGAKRFLALQRFCNVFRIFVLSGQRISEGLQEGGTAAQSAVLRDAAHRTADIARSGHQIGPAMEGESAFPRDFSRSITNAEISGTLDQDLGHWSALFRDRVRAKMGIIARWVPQIILVSVLVWVGWKIIGTYRERIINPMMDMLDQMP